jgi:Lysyl oxidase/WD40-like Beta Propeller Repeat
LTGSGNVLRLAGAVLALTGVLTAPFVAVRASAGAAAPANRTMVIAAAPVGAVSATASGEGRAQVPWLLPGDGQPAIAPDGKRVAFTSARDGGYDIYVADGSTGSVTRVTTSPGADRDPAWSPDGRRLAWTRSGGRGADVWMAQSDGGRARLLAGGVGDQSDPTWSPDGRRVAFVSRRDGNEDIWTAAAEGGQPTLLADALKPLREPAFDRTGLRIAVVVGMEPNADLGIVRLPSGSLRVVAATAETERRPAWSTDGRSILVTRAARGATSLWLAPTGGGAASFVPGSDGLRDADIGPADPLLAPGPELSLPDLDQQAPTGLRVTRGKDGHVRLGFDSSTDNLGPGALRILGARAPSARTMVADQVVEGKAGARLLVPGVAHLRYERHPPHLHWHLQPFVRFELRDVNGGFVGKDRKSGFCLIDRYGRASKKVAGVGKPRFLDDCQKNAPDALTVEQGSSPGYVDRYPAFFHGQDIDITGVPAGVYILVQVANPIRGLRELRYDNNAASVLVQLSPPAGEKRLPGARVLQKCPETALCPP